MSISATAGWILGTVAVLVIGFAVIFILRKVLAGRPRAAAGLARLHRAGEAIAKAADIALTDEEVLLRLIRSQHEKGDLAAAREWNNRIARKREVKAFAAMVEDFTVEPEAEAPAEEEPAEEEAEAAPRPRRTRTTS